VGMTICAFVLAVPVSAVSTGLGTPAGLATALVLAVAVCRRLLLRRLGLLSCAAGGYLACEALCGALALALAAPAHRQPALLCCAAGGAAAMCCCLAPRTVYGTLCPLAGRWVRPGMALLALGLLTCAPAAVAGSFPVQEELGPPGTLLLLPALAIAWRFLAAGPERLAEALRQ
jgi:hypothetical protein